MNPIFNFLIRPNKKIFLNFLPSFFIFLIFFIIGVNVYKDYGISFDEYYHRENGKLYYYFLITKYLYLTYLHSIEMCRNIQKYAEIC